VEWLKCRPWVQTPVLQENRSCFFFFFFVDFGWREAYFLFAMLGLKPRALHVLCYHPTTELCPSALGSFRQGLTM
jgi:hypothetical protein